MAFYPNYQTATAYDYGFSTPFPGAPLYHQNDYMEMLRQQQAMMSRGLFPATGGKATESKPRLAKDEVDKLEREFQKNNKPNSSLKKQLAEEMRVDIARINNWFQNRRAKAKQEKRTQENEARRKSEQATETSISSETIKESFHDHDDDLRPSAAPFPPVHVSTDASSISEASPSEGTQTPEPTYEQPQVVTQEPESEYASPDSSNSFQHQDLNIGYTLGPDQFYPEQTPCDFSASMPSEMIHQTPNHLTLSIPSQYLTTQLPESTSASSFSSYHLSASDMDESFASFPHGLATDMTSPIPINVKQEQIQSEDFDRFDQFSPQSMSRSPPEISTPDFRFKSGSTIDIASRRNSKRPAALVSCVRSQSYNFSGPKTGIEMPRRMEAPSPMRRVASATGNFPRGIQKPGGSGPRSPMYLGPAQENLILQMASRSPISRSPAAPPTPNTPIVPSQQALRETTVSSMSSAEEDKSYSMQNNLTVPQYAMDPTMRTPPDTPGMMTTMPNSLFPAFDYNVSDEPLSTPSFGSFDQEFPNMSSSVPSYVAHGCASQPVTPSFPPSNMGPAFYSSYGGGNTEYNWSDASSVSVKPSPEQSRSRQFQFTNMTAQDFHGE
ncbi:homeobox domain-containing protein [Colletotrichum salicis]|uniref:Homeobox domain-containing protein n=1 Tax=Colletotrichum salicis TaxID=1209931 RepID=A0A135V3H7_9PEZI|nr:homeobox domain-containing protein [Colletotrichum salicis]